MCSGITGFPCGSCNSDGDAGVYIDIKKKDNPSKVHILCKRLARKYSV